MRTRLITSAECGVRNGPNAECGMRNAELTWEVVPHDAHRYIPHSALRIPHSGSRLHRREEELERGPALARPIDPDDTAHLVDRPRDDREAQSRATARRLGRVKGLE